MRPAYPKTQYKQQTHSQTHISKHNKKKPSFYLLKHVPMVVLNVVPVIVQDSLLFFYHHFCYLENKNNKNSKQNQPTSHKSNLCGYICKIRTTNIVRFLCSILPLFTVLVFVFTLFDCIFQKQRNPKRKSTKKNLPLCE